MPSGGSPVLVGLLCAVAASLAYGTSSVLQALGARRSAARADGPGGGARGAGSVTSSGAPTLASTVAAGITAWFLVGTALDVLGFLAGAVSVRFVPLFLSQTVISANLVVTALLGIVVLRLRLRPREWVAVAVVLLALVGVAAAAGPEGHAGGRTAGWLTLVAAVVVAVVGQLVVRRLGSRGAVAAGLAAGTLFGALAVGVRLSDGLETLDVAALVADPAAWSVLVAGAAGFYLHTVALQLGSVTGATAALVAGETVLPGIVGVLFLGDRSRPGLEWLAVAGFVLAVLGAIAVAVLGRPDRDAPGASGPA